MEADLQPLNHGLNSAWRLAQDRGRWKQLVETATLQSGACPRWWWWFLHCFGKRLWHFRWLQTQAATPMHTHVASWLCVWVDTQVLRATDECTSALARVVNTELCIRILNPLSDTAELPINLAAIKLQEKVIRSATESVAHAILDRVVPTLIKVGPSSVSQIRRVIDNKHCCSREIRKGIFQLMLSSVTAATRIILFLLIAYTDRAVSQSCITSNTVPTEADELWGNKELYR